MDALFAAMDTLDRPHALALEQDVMDGLADYALTGDPAPLRQSARLFARLRDAVYDFTTPKTRTLPVRALSA